jgi:hypothetical protein
VQQPPCGIGQTWPDLAKRGGRDDQHAEQREQDQERHGDVRGQQRGQGRGRQEPEHAARVAHRLGAVRGLGRAAGDVHDA